MVVPEAGWGKAVGHTISPTPVPKGKPLREGFSSTLQEMCIHVYRHLPWRARPCHPQTRQRPHSRRHPAPSPCPQTQNPHPSLFRVLQTVPKGMDGGLDKKKRKVFSSAWQHPRPGAGKEKERRKRCMSRRFVLVSLAALSLSLAALRPALGYFIETRPTCVPGPCPEGCRIFVFFDDQTGEYEGFIEVGC